MNKNNPDRPIVVNLTKSYPRSNDVRSPLISSNRLGWKKLNFNYFRYGNCETSVHVLENHTIGLILDRGKVERKLNGVYQLETVIPGSVTVIPARVEHWSAWNKIGRFAMLSIAPEAIATIDPNTVNPDLIELIPTFAKSQSDRLIYGIGTAIKHHLETNSQDEGIYIEHLANALTAHLLQHYCSRKINLKQYANGLAKVKLKQALEYINSNLEESIKLSNIAKELDISQYYFSHLFRQSTGVSPYHYVIQQRVKKAQQLLVDTKMPIADIALACGFGSQSQMTMHFRKLTKTTPRKYRNSHS